MRLECHSCGQWHEEAQRCHPSQPRKPQKQPDQTPEPSRPPPVEPEPAPAPEKRHDCWRCGLAERLPEGGPYWCPKGCGELRTSWPTPPPSSCYWDQQADVAERERHAEREKHRADKLSRAHYGASHVARRLDLQNINNQPYF